MTLTISSGQFTNPDDARTVFFTPFVETTNSTTTSLSTDGNTAGANNRIVISANTTWVFTIQLAARQTGGAAGTVGDSRFVTLEGCIKRDGANNTSLVGIISENKIAEDSGAANWSVSVIADDTNEALDISVIGETNKTIHWVATIKVTEVA